MSKKTEWKIKAKKMRKQGKKLKEISESVGRSTASVYQATKEIDAPVEHRGRPSIRNLSEQKLNIKKLREQGMTLQAIGDKFGVTRERIRQIIIEVDTKTSSN